MTRSLICRFCKVIEDDWWGCFDTSMILEVATEDEHYISFAGFEDAKVAKAFLAEDFVEIIEFERV